MTTTTTATDTTSANPPAPTDTEGQPDTADPAPEASAKVESPNQEAARYRIRARESEAARTVAEARVEQLLRREVDRLAGSQLAQPGDLIDIGPTQVADLLDDSGDVDRAKVEQATADLLTLRPGLAKRGTIDYGAGNRGGQTGGGSTGWAEVIRRRG